MTTLAEPAENLGYIKGESRIVKSDKKKYLADLSAVEISHIEQIVYLVAKKLGYTMDAENVTDPFPESWTANLGDFS